MKQMFNNRKLMKDWNSSKKNIGDFNIMGNSKVASAITGLSFKQSMGIKNLMVGGPTQKQYLRSMKRKPVADRMLDYFKDSDGDMVVNALDCRPFDSSKHGVFSKAANWARGRGYREDSDVPQPVPVRQFHTDVESHNQRIEQEAEREKNNKWIRLATNKENKQIKDKTEINKINESIEDKAEERDMQRIAKKVFGSQEKEAEEAKWNRKRRVKAQLDEDAEKQNEQIKEKKKKAKLMNERKIRGKEAYGQGKYGQGFFQKSKDELSKLEKEKKKADEKYKKEVKEADEAKTKYEEYIKKETTDPAEEKKLEAEMKKQAREETEAKKERNKVKAPYGSAKKEFESKFGKVDKKQATGGFFKENIKDIAVSGFGKVARTASRSTGYLFESPEEKKRLSKQDSETSYARLKQRAERAGVPAAELKKLEERRRGYSMEYIPIKEKGTGNITGYREKKKKLSDAETLTGFSFGSIVKGKVDRLEEGRAKEKEYKKLEKKELTMRTLDSQRKAEMSRLNLDRTAFERKRLKEVTSGRQSSLGGNSRGSIFGGTSWPYSESQSFYGPTPNISTFSSMNTPSSINQLSSNSLPGYLPEPSSGRFDSSAPKFTYKRQVGSFTRKTSRVRKGDVLQIGKSSSPSVKKRKGSAYPWTKPMQGWTRVYEGSGRVVGKGRKKKSQAGIKSFYTEIKPKKQTFQPYASTYELKGKKAKGKKVSFI